MLQNIELQEWLETKVKPTDMQYLKSEVLEHSPYLLQDATKLKEALIKHSEDGDAIAIVGDYDADGMGSSAILTILTRVLNIKSEVFIPDRVIDGYGLSPRIVDLAYEDGYHIIMTCDNGIAAHEAVQHAKDLGMTVYVTDHHEAKDTLPNSDLLVHPAFGDYPWAGLSGGGVAYKIASMFFDHPNFTEVLQDSVLVYAMITLIADVMDLYPSEFNENRHIIRKGLDTLRHKELPQLDILLEEINQQKEFVTETTIGFFLGPTLNASGRIGSPYLPYHLLVEEDLKRARYIAKEMVDVNTIRKDETKVIQDEVSTKINALDPIHVVCRDGVNEGIIGLIAGNITSEYDAPSIVLTPTRNHTDGRAMLKGSCRSSTFSIYEVLESVDQSIFLGWGGHTQAAGVTIFADRLEDFKRELKIEALKRSLLYKKPEQHHLPIDITELSKFEEDLTFLSPMGQGFSKPTGISEVDVITLKTFNKTGHVFLVLETGNEIPTFRTLNTDPVQSMISESKVIRSTELDLMKKGLSREEAIAQSAITYAPASQTKENISSFLLSIIFTFESGYRWREKSFGVVSNIDKMYHNITNKDLNKNKDLLENSKVDKVEKPKAVELSEEQIAENKAVSESLLSTLSGLFGKMEDK